MDYKDIIEKVFKKDYWKRLLVAIIAIFVLALNYNVFLVHNNLVVGGTSGLAIIVSKYSKIAPSMFILSFNIILIILSFIFLGKEQTKRTIFGSILYPILIEVTLPLANKMIPYINFDNIIITILVTGLLYGTCTGMIYKTGYTTGGADILVQIVNKYFHIPTGKASFFINIVIISLGGVAFGIAKVMYAIIIIVINTSLVDKILIGISDSKMFFVYTKKEKEVAGFIINQINAGYTVLTTEGGYTKTKRKMIMCVVPTKDYFLFKESVLAIDPEAFFVINDCYEVAGGFKNKRTFIDD